MQVLIVAQGMCHETEQSECLVTHNAGWHNKFSFKIRNDKCFRGAKKFGTKCKEFTLGM